MRVRGLRLSVPEKNGDGVDLRRPPFDSLDPDGEGREAQLPVGFDLLPWSSSDGTTAAGASSSSAARRARGGERNGSRWRGTGRGEREEQVASLSTRGHGKEGPGSGMAQRGRQGGMAPACRGATVTTIF